MDQYHCSAERWLNDKSVEQGSVIDGRCDNLFDGWRLAMSSLDKMLGWFPHTATDWIALKPGRWQRQKATPMSGPAHPTPSANGYGGLTTRRGPSAARARNADSR